MIVSGQDVRFALRQIRAPGYQLTRWKRSGKSRASCLDRLTGSFI